MLCALLGAGVPLGPDEIAIFDPIHQEAEQGLKDDESTTVSSAARRSSTANP
jgi:hypothetical protein